MVDFDERIVHGIRVLRPSSPAAASRLLATSWACRSRASAVRLRGSKHGWASACWSARRVSTRLGKRVSLSTVGAQARQPNLQQHQLQELSLGTLPLPVTFLRAAWFMENAAWDLAPARASGVVPSFLAPLDKPVPMVATADVGRVAAELLQTHWQGRRVVELEGARVSPNEMAANLARALGRAVRMEAVPRSAWDGLFRSQGMRNPLPRIQMRDGFNEGWIDFEGDAGSIRRGSVSLDTVLRELVARA